MLLGVTLLRKRYPPAKYLCVLLIVAGVALFLYKPKKGTGDTEHVFGYGELLLVSVGTPQRPHRAGTRGGVTPGRNPRGLRWDLPSPGMDPGVSAVP